MNSQPAPPSFPIATSSTARGTSGGPSPATDADDLFAAALALPRGERERFLEEHCGANVGLRTELLSLLAASAAAGDFLPEDLTPAPDLVEPLARLLPEQPGQRIGRYRLLQEIGEGGFGTVWMAEQFEPVSRRVALKIIKAGMDTREVIARFESERQALALMEHQHIAKVFDAGATESGRPFFVMELVRGRPITDYCDEARLDTAGRLALFADVCAAISHAHQKGVIHRDIKPSNVLVTLDGEQPVVKVIDFGIAKATEGRLTDKTLFTRFEQFVGTPAYMSPEQARWSGLDVDTRSDIYSLGALLYELIAGRPPFDASALATAGVEEVRRIIGEVEPPRPSARLRTTAGEERLRLAQARGTGPAGLPRLVEPDLDWIVMKALEKDRTRRYQTVNALAEDLTHFLGDEPVSARPPSRAYLLGKFARRHRAALRAGTGILALLLVATAVSTWQAVRARRAEQRALSSEATAQVETAHTQEQRQRADAESERAQEQLYEAQMHVALQTWREHRGTGAVRELLARWEPAAGAVDRRHWEWHYLRALPERNLRTLHAKGREEASGVAWHVGTQRLAEGTADGFVRIWDMERGKPSGTLRGPAPALRFWGGRWLAWNPSGSRLAAAGGDGTVWLWEFGPAASPLPTSPTRVLRTNAPLSGVTFSSDGQRLAAWGERGLVPIWQSDSGQVEAELARPVMIAAAAWSPDDQTLALGHYDGTVTFSAPQTGAPVTTLAAQADQIYDLAWSPDSTRLATSGANEFWLSIWDVATKQRVLGPLRHSHGVTSLAWEPGGQRLASGSMDEEVKIWDTASGRVEVVLRGLEDRVTALAWGAGGQLAAGGGFGTVKVWTSLREQEWETLSGNGRRITAVAWNPVDGRLASAGDDGRIRIWHTATGSVQLSIPAHQESAIFPEYGLVRSLAWSPDGQRLASAGFDGTARVWETRTGQEIHALAADHGARWCLAWSPDGTTLAVGSQDGTIQLAEGFPGRPTVRQFVANFDVSWSGHAARGGVRTLAWSPRGDRLASGGWDKLVKIWDPTRGVEMQRLTGHTRTVVSLAWSPDGQQIVTGEGSGHMQIWDPQTGRKIQRLRGHDDVVDAVRWSPDGTRIASAGLDNSVRLWNPRTGQEAFVLRGKSGMFHDLSWSRDGTQLAAASSDGDVWIWRAGSEAKRGE